MNDAGQVVGDAGTASGDSHLFSWDTANGMKDLGSPAGSVGVGAAGLNASGQICGSFTPSASPGSNHAYVYSGGTFHDLGVPSGYASSQATGINASGQTCGYVSDTSFNPTAFVHSGTGPLTSADLLPLPAGYTQPQATGINNAGQVVGSLTDANFGNVGFVYSGGATQVVSLGALYGVNNVGVAVGVDAVNAGGFLYNIAAQATQAGPSVCASPVALNDSTGFQASFPYTNRAYLDATDIGALPGGSDSVGNAINASGQTAGVSRTDGGRSHAVLRDGSGLHDLGTLLTETRPKNAITSHAYAINAGGQIAGDSYTASFLIHAILYDAAHGMQDLGSLNGANGQSFAFGLNDSGQVTGYADAPGGSGGYHAFLYTAAGGMKDLGTLPGGANSYAQAINSAGQVVGQSDLTGGQSHAFSYTAAGGMKDLGTLPGGTTSYANAVNDKGQVAGFGDVTGGETHAFLYTAAGGMQDLGTLPGGTNSVATGLNASGQVVGHADDAGGRETAFVWDLAHGMRDLNALLTPGAGFTLTRANAINDKGQVTGYGVNAAGQTHGFILTPLGHNHLLWTSPDGRAVLWDGTPSGAYTDGGQYGPYTDGGGTWHAVTACAGPDGLSHLLWGNPDGRSVLWDGKADGTYTDGGQYGPYTDAGGTWRAVAASAGP